jgi:papain fold toxin 1 (glutamine deamidase) of polymorphic toxin system
MSGDWSVLGFSEDPVRGDPAAARTLAQESQREGQRWEEQARSLRAVASQGGAIQMVGEFAPVARQALQGHPTEATALARARIGAGEALLAYANVLADAKRESNFALDQGRQAKRAYDTAKQRYDQVVAQMNALPKTVPAPQYPAVMAQYNALNAQLQQASQQMQQADTQLRAAQQRATQAGQRAAQQEQAAAQRVRAVAPTKAPATNGSTAGGLSGIAGIRFGARGSRPLADGRRTDLGPQVRQINPTGSTTNCGYCTVAFANRYRGAWDSMTVAPANATGMLRAETFQRYFGSSWKPGGYQDVSADLGRRGHGAQGLLAMGNKEGHVVNVVNHRGQLIMIDPQASQANRYNAQVGQILRSKYGSNIWYLPIP